MRNRTRSFEQAKGVGDRTLGRGSFPKAFTLLHVDRPRFQATIEAFEAYRDQGFSFTDASTVALVKEKHIDHVLTFDDDFDGVIDRLVPRDVG